MKIKISGRVLWIPQRLVTIWPQVPLAIKRLKLARAELVFSLAAVGSRLLADLVKGDRNSPAFQDLLEAGLQQS